MTNYDNPRYMSDFPFLADYATCVHRWTYVKDAAKGQRVNPSGSLMLFKKGNTFHVERYGRTICTISPSNILTVHKWKYLFGAIYYLPFFSGSNGRRVHRINVRKSRNGRGWVHNGPHDPMKRDPLAFDGIKFDLTTGRCLNPKVEPPNEEPERKPKVYKAYLAALNMAKTNATAQRRLGVFGEAATRYIPRGEPLDPKVVAHELKTGSLTTVMAEVQRRVPRYGYYDWQAKKIELVADAEIKALKAVIDQVGRRDIKKHFGVYRQKK